MMGKNDKPQIIDLYFMCNFSYLMMIMLIEGQELKKHKKMKTEN